jgi:hypothetical protein
MVAVVIGCVTSLLTFSGLTLRLAAPGTFYWSFVPLAEVLALAVACAGERGRVPFRTKVDLFFTGHLPWLLWLTGLAATFSFLPAAQAFALTDSLWLYCAAPVVIVWSAWIDFCFFRSVGGNSGGAALGRLILQRAISWSLIVVIFSGGALLPGRAGFSL